MVQSPKTQKRWRKWPKVPTRLVALVRVGAACRKDAGTQERKIRILLGKKKIKEIKRGNGFGFNGCLGG